MSKLRSTLVTCLLVSGMLNAACFKSKNVVTKVPPVGYTKPVALNGVPYALPRTVVTVRLPFKLVEKKPGELQRYTPCFFSREVAAGRITEESKAYSLDTPTFSSHGEPDPNEHYIAKIKGGFFENKTMELAFNSEGVITKGDASSENTAIDVAIKGVRTAISVGASIAKGAAAVKNAPHTRNLTINEVTALRNAQMEICRSIIVAEAASNAASKAVEAAKNGAPALVAFANAADTAAKTAEQKIEIAKGHLASTTTLLSLADDDGDGAQAATPAQQRKLIEMTHNIAGTAIPATATTATTAAMPATPAKTSLFEEVKTEALNVSAAVNNLITALGADEKAKELRTKVEKITAAISFSTNQDAFLNGFLEAKRQYEMLVALKEKRQNFDTGDSLPQETLKLKLDQLDAAVNTQQNTFFFGTKSDDNWAPEFRFVPGKSVLAAGGYNTSQTSPALLVFSKELGVCDTTEAVEQGVIIKDSFKADMCPLASNKSEALWVRVDRVTADDGFLGHMAAANDRDEKRGERGFYYRIPAAAVVKLERGALTAGQITNLTLQSMTGQRWRQSNPDEAAPAIPLMPPGKEIARARIKVAQLGVTASLPASSAGRKTQYTVEFDENTGAMKNFKLASNALLEKSIVDEASGAANDILGAKEARDKAKTDAAKSAAEANDPLAQKKRELDLLKTQNEINEEKKKLESSTPPPEQPQQ